MEYTDRTAKALNKAFWILLIVGGILLAKHAQIIHIWEDGSIALGRAFPYIWTACLPFCICQ